MKTALFVSMMVMASAPAFAQQDRGDGKTEDGKTIVYERNTTILFDETTIRGTEWKPVGILVVSHVGASFEKMIPERAHFKVELAKSTGKTGDAPSPSMK